MLAEFPGRRAGGTAWTRSSAPSPRPRSGCGRSGSQSCTGAAARCCSLSLHHGTDEAEACFGTALGLARSQHSLALELRAATSLARLWRRNEASERSRELLAGAYGRFHRKGSTPSTCARLGASSKRWAACLISRRPRTCRSLMRLQISCSGQIDARCLKRNARAHRTPSRAGMGITRIANVTGLDPVGVPVVTVVRPNARSLAVSQGKGVMLAAAQGLGDHVEAAELYHAETVSGPLWWARPDELVGGRSFVDPLELPRSSAVSTEDGPMAWIQGVDLVRDGPILVPFAAVLRRLYACRGHARDRPVHDHRRTRRRQRPRRGHPPGPDRAG